MRYRCVTKTARPIAIPDDTINIMVISKGWNFNDYKELQRFGIVWDGMGLSGCVTGEIQVCYRKIIRITLGITPGIT